MMDKKFLQTKTVKEAAPSLLLRKVIYKTIYILKIDFLERP